MESKKSGFLPSGTNIRANGRAKMVAKSIEIGSGAKKRADFGLRVFVKSNKGGNGASEPALCWYSKMLVQQNSLMIPR